MGGIIAPTWPLDTDLAQQEVEERQDLLYKEALDTDEGMGFHMDTLPTAQRLSQ